jgi:hypothetical protein
MIVNVDLVIYHYTIVSGTSTVCQYVYTTIFLKIDHFIHKSAKHITQNQIFSKPKDFQV